MTKSWAIRVRVGVGFLLHRSSQRSKAFRAVRVLLSCVAKQCFTTAAGWSSKQRRPPCRPVGSASRNRSASMRGNPEGTSMYRPETSRIVRAALRVFAPPACRASTGLKSKIKSACFPGIPAMESTHPKRKRPGFPGRHQDSTTRQSPGQTQNVQPMAPKLALAWSIAVLHWAARAALSVTAAQLLFDCSMPCFIMSRWASGTLSAIQA